ncbi:MAG: hypothetical protein E6H07_02650 [Bacteroidetes bacterium]|nr:MAG: hypothetical protein E6H07_02650 [Bacteroidota bacterium]
MNFQKCLPYLIIIQFLFSGSAYGQMITGTWNGKIGKQKAEVKIVQKGDSLTGTSYYYESSGSFRRYSIKGYFDKNTNEVIWWDDQLIEERTGKFSLGSLGKIPLLSSADFNCPGGGRMMLDGKAAEKENQSVTKGDLHLDKTETSTFNDEWNFIIENYTFGTNDPYLIDSVEAIAGTKIIEDPVIREERTIAPVIKKEEPVVQKQVKKQEPIETITKEEARPVPPVIAKPIEKKFTERTKVFIKEIPVSGDSIELRFYDNAEVDGDSISLFLNNKLVFEHIRLTAVAYTIKLSVQDLNESNELVMVAENLGSIPPNTSYMVAIVKDERYDARLASTEGSSAMIRLVKSN